METNIKRRSLGKGLEELFNNEQLNFDKIEETIVNETSESDIIHINIDDLRPNPYQPRKIFDEEKLKELSASIKEHGVFQPIIVKKSSIKGYEIIAGERRVRASKMAGLTTIPAIVREFNDDEMMQIAVLENLQREDLNAIEEANAYKNLLAMLKITQEELATKLGKSRSHITNTIGLLTLPEEVKNMIIDGKITMSHARTLSKLEDKEKIIELANKIVQDNLNVRDVEIKTQSIKRGNPFKSTKEKEYQYVENMMCEKLGTKVKISSNKINISFNNVNDLNRILEILNINEK